MADQTKARKTPTAPSVTSRAKILLVDDNQADLRALLDGLDCDLVEALSGDEALQRVLSDEFAAILLDANMPGLSGFDTAKLLRANSRSQHTPMIFLTANHLDRTEIELGYALGAVDFLVKPLVPIVLQAKVRGLIDLFVEKQRAEHEADQLRLLIQATTDYAIFMLDRKGHVITWNTGAEHIKGYKAHEIIGQHFSRFYPQEAIDRGWPDHELKVAKAEGRFEDEGWRLRKDGSRFWANVVITALHGEAGSFVGFSKITRDLTERKLSEENARRLAEETAARQVTQRERERLHVTLESIGDAVISTDVEGRVEFLNRVAQELVGWRNDEAARRTLGEVFTIVNEQTRQPVENPALRALKEGVIVGLANHTVLISKDGKERPIDDSAAPIRDSGGNIIGSVLVFRDISERKRNEAALAERVRLLALNASVGAALVKGDGLGQVLHRCAEALVEHLDGAFARIWTLNESDAVLELRASAGMYTHLDGPHSRIPVGRYKIGLIAQERQPHLTNAVVGDPRVSDQEWAKREGMIAFAGYPLLVDGRLVGVMAMFARHELTKATLEAMASVADEMAVGIERKSTQERLNEQREWLSVTLASIGDAVITTDKRGRVTFLNGVAEQLTGWTRRDADGEPLDSVFVILNERTRQPVQNPVGRVIRDGVVVGLGNHTVLIAKDGTERPIDDSAAPIRDSSGGLIGVVLIFRDVTEQRQSEQEVRQSEARKSAILETALDCIITMDHEGSVVEFNPAAERTFGFKREEVIGRELAEFIIPPSLRQKHYQGIAHYLATGEGPALGKRLEVPALRADGTEFPVELAITRISTGGAPLFTAYLRDISEQKRQQQYRNVRQGVTSALAEARTLEDGAKGVLAVVCENLGWEIGFVWTVNDHADALVCRQSWHKADRETTEFETTSCRRIFTKGEGLPGRVWSSGETTFIFDVLKDANFPRAAPATKEGLHSAVGCPLIVGEKTIGVIELFTHRLREPDTDLLEIIGTMGGSLAQFIERTAAENRRRATEHRLQAIFNQQFQFMAILDPDGTVVEANETCFTATGVSREDVIGRRFWDTPWWNQLPEMGPKWQTMIAQAAGGSPPVTGEMQYALSDGTIRQAITVVSALKGDGGEILNVVVEGRDITEAKRQEQALRESEEKLRLLADTIPQLAWMAKPDGDIFWYNRRWYDYTGTTPEQMQGWGWQSVHDPDVLPQVVERWKRSLATGEPFDMVFPLRGADSVLRPFLTRVNPLKNDDGRILYWFGTNTDITELRQAREALADSEERLRLALDAGRMGVWDWNVRTGDLKWSDSLEPLHGLAPGTFGGTFEHFQHLIHPDDRGTVNRAIREALEHHGEFHVEFRNVGQNGVIHRIAGSGKVFLGDDGQPLRMIGIGLDVTQRRRSEQTARFLADASAALAMLVDFDSTLQKVASLAVPHFADWVSVDVLEDHGDLRRVAVAHVDPAKVQLAHDLHRRFPPDPSAPQGVWNILRTGQAEIVPEITDDILVASVKEEELLGVLRQLGLKSYIGVPLTVRGKTLGVLTFIVAESGHVYDDTDLAVAKDLASRVAIAIENSQLYRELRDADRRKDEFLATLAHELRNPLAPIRNGLQILRLAGGGGEMVEEARSMMERQLTHMVRLVDDLLDVSRITRNRLELRKERVALATVIHTAVETSRPMIEEFGHTFSVTLTKAPVYLDADPMRLAQVFSNLLNNAAKYTEPGGRITLTAETQGADAVVRVRDNGLGIPLEAQSRIFEMFSQEDRNIERAQGGLGIGLTLVRRLAEMHGGTVEATSEGPGKGSEFTVRIPMLKKVQSGASSNASGPGVTGSKRRILVVDDNRDAAESLGLMLKLMGNEVRTAADGLAAVQVAETYRPEMILLDIGLPKLNGYDACRRIREQSWSKGMVIVALTGWGQEEDRRRSEEAGFDHHLVKPVDVDSLTKLLAQAK